jgi:hypothetical protein
MILAYSMSISNSSKKMALVEDSFSQYFSNQQHGGLAVRQLVPKND